MSTLKVNIFLNFINVFNLYMLLLFFLIFDKVPILEIIIQNVEINIAFAMKLVKCCRKSHEMSHINSKSEKNKKP